MSERTRMRSRGCIAMFSLRVRRCAGAERQSGRRCAARRTCVACECSTLARGGGWTGRTTRRPYVPFTHAPLVLKLSASKKYTPKDRIILPVLDRCIRFLTLETAFETSWDMYVYFFYWTRYRLVTGSRHNNCFNRWLWIFLHVNVGSYYKR